MGSSVDQCAVFALLVLAIIPETSAQTISWDSACGSTKGCFPDCTGGCEYLVTWQDTGTNLAFNLKAVESDTDVYLAIAFSKDRRMGDDSVVGCLVPGGVVYSYVNDGLHTDELSPVTLGLSSTSVTQTNGIIECSFTRDYDNSDSDFYNLNGDEYYIQLVIGEAESGSSKLEHHYMIPWFSENRVNFNSHYIVGEYKLNSPLVKLHGIMMVFAWLLFSMLGIMTARYNKDMLPETKLFGTKVWFQLHRGVMIAVVVCIFIGFIPIFVEVEGYSQIPPPQDEGYTTSHPVLGIIITVLTFLNPIGALLRPNPDHKYRWIFNWAHLALGLITQFLAILTIFFGYVLDRSKLNTAPIVVTGIQLFVIAVFAVALEINKWFGTKKGSIDISLEEKSDPDDDGNEKKKPETGGQNSKLPFIALCVFAVLMFGFTIAVLGIIAAG